LESIAQEIVMPRNNLSLDELKVRVLKMKHALYNEQPPGKCQDWHDGAHDMLNKVLDTLDEYRY
jgi:hypothetical protein